MSELANRRCEPCEGGVEPLTSTESRKLLASIDKGWSLQQDGRSIERTFSFPVFGRTMGFVNAVAWVATVEGHHPEMTVNYGSCVVRLTTNAINGLSDNDFICAAKIDQLAAD
ncbi:MAG: 4a-hydroxytetrahydrobiopterin dehydratase [Woeseia sp.]|nr:4a-hydroxytetrahydrobiopterin dehydratase [Woeseia sp.]NNE62214.1 4a-hydroxytetrahydrobiopterin dehydratase [Woeseia sp.]